MVGARSGTACRDGGIELRHRAIEIEVADGPANGLEVPRIGDAKQRTFAVYQLLGLAVQLRAEPSQQARHTRQRSLVNDRDNLVRSAHGSVLQRVSPFATQRIALARLAGRKLARRVQRHRPLAQHARLARRLAQAVDVIGPRHIGARQRGDRRDRWRRGRRARASACSRWQTG